MESFFPQSFRELLGAITIVIGIAFSFISIAKGSREHCLRGAGLFLLAGIVLFANDSWTYFASVFIIGTAITQLEFLQNLAAIIRGSKEYFDYQKEFLSQSEIEKTIEKEVRENEEISETEKGTDKEIGITITRSNLTPGQFGLIVEEYAFKYLERRYGKPIERHIRFRGKTLLADFDGIMKDDETARIFEIKSTRTGILPRRAIVDHIKIMAEGVKGYMDATKKPAILNVVLVGHFNDEFIAKIDEYKSDIKSQVTDVEIQFDILSFKDIDAEAILKNI